ncbi:hypothetical protein AM493_06130 [Flavobacterium akiainvivens]|uniref:Probable membrane transporter protein n=1 Tax=Flavobacterium akiainvivens TaxID=1202724 RepID=A0A0M8MHE9_9FLAO|nr:sulfite exporter TauE/SafE family protein [Flavobacterium akiainvivens]KOS05658.1 hypothetical protein AM493_06130 [Flavobacterium akiainvivens]SFQ36156.1 hypothetical protein SAMN05444144_103262 [Flavobacterium akiainvivens]
MEVITLILIGFIIGSFGTLIGAGGGFILVPFLLIFYPDLGPEVTVAISMAVVSVNAISGTMAYARSGRIDYKAGVVFALFTIPGSILGALTVKYIPQGVFNIIFGIMLVLLAVYLFYKNSISQRQLALFVPGKGHTSHTLTDRSGTTYTYCYNNTTGNLISLIVGYISPLLGIGGGIIHVPAMVNWLKFPVHVATATSHFILAIMATVTVVTHAVMGTYEQTDTLNMVLYLSLGVVPGAQLGAFFSHRLKSSVILQVLSACMVLVGIRILFNTH